MSLIEEEYCENISNFWINQGINMARQEQQDKRQAEHDRESYYCELCGRKIYKESDVFGDADTCLCQNCFEALEEI